MEKRSFVKVDEGITHEDDENPRPGGAIVWAIGALIVEIIAVITVFGWWASHHS